MFLISGMITLLILKCTGRGRLGLVESTAKYPAAASNGTLLQWIYNGNIEWGICCHGKGDTRFTGTAKGKDYSKNLRVLSCFTLSLIITSKLTTQQESLLRQQEQQKLAEESQLRQQEQEKLAKEQTRVASLEAEKQQLEDQITMLTKKATGMEDTYTYVILPFIMWGRTTVHASKHVASLYFLACVLFHNYHSVVSLITSLSIL